MTSIQTTTYYGWLAQLARASALQAGGHRFESYITHHKLWINEKAYNLSYVLFLFKYFIGFWLHSL